MVTAEAALVIPAIAACALALVWGLAVMVDAMTLADVTRQVARDVARGVSVAEALEAAAAQDPGAVIDVQQEAGVVSVTARKEAVAPVPLLQGLRLPLRESVTISAEWQ